MHRFLVPVGPDDEYATRQAGYITELVDAAESVDAVVLHVFKQINAAEEGGEIDLREYAEPPESYRQTVDRLRDAGANVVERAESGDVVDAILAVADDVEADSIVIGGRKRSPTGKALFGSVTQDVILQSDRPVTVIGSELS
ncbi:universal stress protein [Haloferacaceae archaeon DSL9]